MVGEDTETEEKKATTREVEEKEKDVSQKAALVL